MMSYGELISYVLVRHDITMTDEIGEQASADIGQSICYGVRVEF